MPNHDSKDIRRGDKPPPARATVSPWGHDRGGETNYGITKSTLDTYQQKYGGLGESGRPVTVKDLTKEQAQTIYRKKYYDERVSAKLATTKPQATYSISA